MPYEPLTRWISGSGRRGLAAWVGVKVSRSDWRRSPTRQAEGWCEIVDRLDRRSAWSRPRDELLPPGTARDGRSRAHGLVQAPLLRDTHLWLVFFVRLVLGWRSLKPFGRRHTWEVARSRRP
jgi:hypothetical protein